MVLSLSHPRVNCLLGGLKHDFICFGTTVKNSGQRDKKTTTFIKQGHITLIKSDNLDFNVSIKISNVDLSIYQRILTVYTLSSTTILNIKTNNKTCLKSIKPAY